MPTLGLLSNSLLWRAIPLAANQSSARLKTVCSAIIQPQGLASIARKQSWPGKCAQIVGVAACENGQGWLDGIIDYSPNAHRDSMPLQQAVIRGSPGIEVSVTTHVLGNDVLSRTIGR